MALNKYSTPEEVTKTALVAHILCFYPEFNPHELTIMHLERVIRILSTKAMETL